MTEAGGVDLSTSPPSALTSMYYDAFGQYGKPTRS
jgi:hypothetical protein